LLIEEGGFVDMLKKKWKARKTKELYPKVKSKIIKTKEDKSTCDCGNTLYFVTSPFETIERRVCSKCGRLHYAEPMPPIDIASIVIKQLEEKRYGVQY
jgi:hypothetical protein